MWRVMAKRKHPKLLQNLPRSFLFADFSVWRSERVPSWLILFLCFQWFWQIKWTNNKVRMSSRSPHGEKLVRKCRILNTFVVFCKLSDFVFQHSRMFAPSTKQKKCLLEVSEERKQKRETLSKIVSVLRTSTSSQRSPTKYCKLSYCLLDTHFINLSVWQMFTKIDNDRIAMCFLVKMKVLGFLSLFRKQLICELKMKQWTKNKNKNDKKWKDLAMDTNTKDEKITKGNTII